MKNPLGLPEIQQICATHGIEVKALHGVTGSFGKQLFLVNHAFLVRVAAAPMTLEQAKVSRVATLALVPKLLHTGTLPREVEPVYYTILTLLPGDDFVNLYGATTTAQQQQLGRAVAGFLDRLHEFTGPHYDIGLYVPALPAFVGSWRAGHQRYWELLRQGADSLPLQPASRQLFERAHAFLQGASGALDFQTGPKLLHNDLHPKNLLLAQGQLSGVIDWECSQFGEADFELCHFIHWCLYPPHPTIDFRPFLQAFFAAAPRCTQVPQLAQRLTIYQIEHELQQIIWNGSQVESWRVPRLARWLEGGVEDLLRELGV